jgi:hypothetical protein
MAKKYVRTTPADKIRIDLQKKTGRFTLRIALTEETAHNLYERLHKRFQRKGMAR